MTKTQELVDRALYEKRKGSYMLVKTSPITAQQVEQIFSRTPKEHIYERPAKGGGTWKYVTGGIRQKGS